MVDNEERLGELIDLKKPTKMDLIELIEVMKGFITECQLNRDEFIYTHKVYGDKDKFGRNPLPNTFVNTIIPRNLLNQLIKQIQKVEVK